MNTSDLLEKGHLMVIQVVDGLPELQWDVPGVCGEWSVKDIVAHLASYERVILDAREWKTSMLSKDVRCKNTFLSWYLIKYTKGLFDQFNNSKQHLNSNQSNNPPFQCQSMFLTQMTSQGSSKFISIIQFLVQYRHSHGNVQIL